MKLSNEIIGLVAGILTSTAMIPQVVKTIKERDAESISYFMVIILILGTGTWAYYGIVKNDLPIIITNIFSCIVNCVMLFCRIKFSPASDKKN